MPRTITHLLTTDGKEPPLNAAGKAEYAKRQAALKAGDKKIDPMSDCLMHGTPRLLYAPYPFLILQTTRSVDFVHEANHTFRIIYWDKALPDDPDPDYLGYSIARFEGKTLVIDTIGLQRQDLARLFGPAARREAEGAGALHARRSQHHQGDGDASPTRSSTALPWTTPLHAEEAARHGHQGERLHGHSPDVSLGLRPAAQQPL